MINDYIHFVHWATNNPILQGLLNLGVMALLPFLLALAWAVAYWGFNLCLAVAMALLLPWAAVFEYIPGKIGAACYWYWRYCMAIPFQMMGWIDNHGVPTIFPWVAWKAVQNTFKKFEGVQIAMAHNRVEYNRKGYSEIVDCDSMVASGWDKHRYIDRVASISTQYKVEAAS